ncbi:hypothetical protein [uncultured Bacteroides sp.]|uniref:hypothetical protein n=1 Tax=uncultured Bacteroides sp. TaxID=162156 RepID=UPI002599D15F|nr:hypothetical protein [uncultured Bacteroides sp.]
MQTYQHKNAAVARTLETSPRAARQPSIEQIIRMDSWAVPSAAPLQRVPAYNLDDESGFPKMSLFSLYAAGANQHTSDTQYTGNSAFLGWSSIMSFQTRDHKFTDFSARQMDGQGCLKPEKITPGGGYSTDQVVTRGVDSCTVITVSFHDKQVMAHLDGKDLNEAALAEMKNAVPVGPLEGEAEADFPQIFISVLDDRKINEAGGKRVVFARQVIEQFYLLKDSLVKAGALIDQETNLETLLLYGLPSGHGVRLYIRGDMQSPGISYGQHPEIGLFTEPSDGGGDAKSIFGSHNSYMDFYRNKCVEDVMDRTFFASLNASPADFKQAMGTGVLEIDKVKEALFDEDDDFLFRCICNKYRDLANEFKADELARLPVEKQAIVLEVFYQELPDNCLLVLCRDEKGIRQHLRVQSKWDTDILPRLQSIRGSKISTGKIVALTSGLVLAAAAGFGLYKIISKRS